MARPRLILAGENGYHLRCRRSPEPPPHPQEKDRPDRGHDQIADPAIEGDVEQSGERAADEGAGDADEQIGEQAMIARRHLLGDVAGEDADDEHAEKADPRHGQESMSLIFHFELRRLKRAAPPLTAPATLWASRVISGVSPPPQ